MSFGTYLEGTRAHGAVSDPSYNAAEYLELANPILSMWQQGNFRKENIIGALPPLLRSAEDPKGIILDPIYEPMRPLFQLPSLFTLSEEFVVGCGRPTSSIFAMNFYSVENSPRTMKMCRPPEWCWCHIQTMRIYTGFLLGSICTHTNGSCSSMTDDRKPVHLQPTTDYIGWYKRVDYDRQDIQKKDMIAYSLAITLVHEHARTVWQTRDHTRWTLKIGKLSLPQIATTRVDHSEPCYSPSDWQSGLDDRRNNICVPQLQWTE